ncbi:MAG: flagellar motor protein PomA [Rhodospirillales bacterium]|jgi:chemotaxis protein MotA|nr:flagellar motor protein PomA [Rhodospirillales bacterium]MBT4040574.1 flagellar motor protein PomA [Rhodospirillales bacterium]MBT4627019.1 flagellar motor protein PomA [Rhodospirillales bacterium]MBT5352222.1 flagellar motor protein PomA [Rhodospirillales bacterium]MBT5520606.1 flagellar motor protein PomA [Rhodospirillales bacterium]
MDIATIIGIVAGLVVIVISIMLDGDLGSFLNAPGMAIVFGGTVAATLVKFPMKDFIQSLKIGFSVAIKNSKNDPNYIYDKSLEMAGLVRTGGLLALESVQLENELFQRGIGMCTDGHNLDVIRATIDREVIVTIETQEMGENFWRGIGDAGPAWGMIGTLIGLVQMLANLDDPAAIGPAMAIAMLTTFYGAVMANLVAIPLADKLAIKIDADRRVHDLIVESIVQIQQNTSPTALAEILSAFLPSGSKPAKDEE